MNHDLCTDFSFPNIISKKAVHFGRLFAGRKVTQLDDAVHVSSPINLIIMRWKLEEVNPQLIELCTDMLGLCSNSVSKYSKPKSRTFAAGEAVMGVDAILRDTETDEDRALRVEVLAVGGTACVSDTGFRQTVTHDAPSMILSSPVRWPIPLRTPAFKNLQVQGNEETDGDLNEVGEMPGAQRKRTVLARMRSKRFYRLRKGGATANR
ncbi:hypothetical protein [Pelagivirga sediminicola]|uniref:hypothetical protein n=1 Tax=Pelagivirga sediminicola TaxID=2170575 RepID=UPI0014030ED2|nr:hypothetical protein [Pelagivirga sediminicola]